MTTQIFNECIAEVEKHYLAVNNVTTEIALLTILSNMYEGPLKKDKFCRAKVKATIQKLNPAYAEGYFKK